MTTPLPEPPDDEALVLAMTLYGEARGESNAGLRAVAAVVMNRVARSTARLPRGMWWGNTVREVCLKPGQISCWNEGPPPDPNRAKMFKVWETWEAGLSNTNTRNFKRCLRVASMLYVYDVLNFCSPPDPTSGSTHYHTVGLDAWWSRDLTPVVVIEGHEFYNDVD